jgi:hypothetical protein
MQPDAPGGKTRREIILPKGNQRNAKKRERSTTKSANQHNSTHPTLFLQPP